MGVEEREGPALGKEFSEGCCHREWAGGTKVLQEMRGENVPLPKVVLYFRIALGAQLRQDPRFVPCEASM